MDNNASAVIETVARLYGEWIETDDGRQWSESDYRFAEYLTQNEPTVAAFLVAFAVGDLRAEGLLDVPVNEP